MADQRLIDDLAVGTVEVLPDGASPPSSPSPNARAARCASSSASTPPHPTSTWATRSCSTSCASSRTPVTSPCSSSATTRRASATPRAAPRRAPGSTPPSSTPTPHLPGAGLPHPRPRPGAARGALQRRVARAAHHGAALRARRDDHGGAHPRARRLREALQRAPADLDARDALPAGPGLRLGRRALRHRARRHRAEVQPVHGPRPAAVLRPGAPGHHDGRHPAGHRRRRAHEQVARQLHRRQRRPARRLRQGHEHPRRGDHDLLPPAHRRTTPPRSPPSKRGLASGALNPRDLKARLAREIITRLRGEAAAAEAEEHFDRVFRRHEAAGDVQTLVLAPADIEDGAVYLPAAMERWFGDQLAPRAGGASCRAA